MATQKPLYRMIPEIIDHYVEYVDYLEMNRRLYEIREGQLLEEVKMSLRKEIKSDSTFNRVCERIPSINVIRKVTDKLSKVYIEDPIRRVNSDQDQEIVRQIASIGQLDNCMKVANEFYNMHGMFAIEPYVREGMQRFRVLGGHQFLPYSDDPSDPKNMTVFIKLMGNDVVNVRPKYDEDGNKNTTEDEIRTVNILALYSDDEFLIIDTAGSIRRDKMEEMGISMPIGRNTSPNPFGVIPFMYGNRSHTELIPFPNQEGLNMSILVPKLYADLNYAAQFQSHSIIWVKNSDLTGQAAEPDTIVNLGERTEENGDPEMGVISPSVDIPNVLSMIASQLNAYFSSLGIKTSIPDNNSSDASGVAKAIDEADTSAERKSQMEVFREIEVSLWSLIKDMQDVWVDNGVLDIENRKLSDTFMNSFTVMFAEMKPLKTMRQKIEEIQLLRDQKLISKRQALKVLMPEMSDEQIDSWLEELEEESERNMEMMFGGEGTLQASRSAEGTFLEGNQEAAQQQPDENLESREQ